jgi:hypothetical protein
MKQCIACKHSEANDAAKTCPKCGEGSWRQLAPKAQEPAAKAAEVEAVEDVPIEPAKHLPERRRRRL